MPRILSQFRQKKKTGEPSNESSPVTLKCKGYQLTSAELLFH